MIGIIKKYFEMIKKLLNDSPAIVLAIPTLLGSGGFISNLAIALSDGKIDSTELHTLMSTASGAQIVILIIIMYALKK